MSTPRLQAGARAIALEIAAEARAEWGFATTIIARAVRAHREAARLSYPTWLLEAWTADYGAAEATALAEAMNQRAPLAVRVNTARIDRDALAGRLGEEHVVARPAALSPVGLVFETRVNAFG